MRQHSDPKQGHTLALQGHLTLRRKHASLRQLEALLEFPMVLLGFVWLGLLVVEMVSGLSPALEYLGTAIWGVFLLDFVLRFATARRKLAYVKSNWVTAIALLIPALRMFRLARAVRLLRLSKTVRGLRLVRVLSSLNRGMRALAETMARSGFGYVALLTVMITVVGAAGMYAFERSGDAEAFNDFPTALWWTAMLMTTMGSESWPKSAEGRTLCLLMSIYAFTVFSYVTATIARFFIVQSKQPVETAAADRAALELAALREEVRDLAAHVRRS